MKDERSRDRCDPRGARYASDVVAFMRMQPQCTRAHLVAIKHTALEVTPYTGIRREVSRRGRHSSHPLPLRSRLLVTNDEKPNSCKFRNYQDQVVGVLSSVVYVGESSMMDGIGNTAVHVYRWISKDIISISGCTTAVPVALSCIVRCQGPGRCGWRRQCSVASRGRRAAVQVRGWRERNVGPRLIKVMDVDSRDCG